MNAKERKRAESAILKLTAALLNGQHVEVTGKAGFVIYMGHSTVPRRDCYWYEGPHGRTYKEDPAEIVKTILPHVGTLALEQAKVRPHPSEGKFPVDETPRTTNPTSVTTPERPVRRDATR